jgi:xanthosine utilization system XapX-like protein
MDPEYRKIRILFISPEFLAVAVIGLVGYFIDQRVLVISIVCSAITFAVAAWRGDEAEHVISQYCAGGIVWGVIIVVFKLLVIGFIQKGEGAFGGVELTPWQDYALAVDYSNKMMYVALIGPVVWALWIMNVAFQKIRAASVRHTAELLERQKTKNRWGNSSAN